MKSETAKRKDAYAAGQVGEDSTDIFTLMVKANEEEGAKLRLDDSELVRRPSYVVLQYCTNRSGIQIGNVFGLMVAGHGTSL